MVDLVFEVFGDCICGVLDEGLTCVGFKGWFI